MRSAADLLMLNPGGASAAPGANLNLPCYPPGGAGLAPTVRRGGGLPAHAPAFPAMSQLLAGPAAARLRAPRCPLLRSSHTPLPRGTNAQILQYFGGSVAYLKFSGGNQVEGAAGLQGAMAAGGTNDHIPNQVRGARWLFCALCCKWRNTLPPPLLVPQPRQASPASSYPGRRLLTRCPAPPPPPPQNDFDTPYTGSWRLMLEGDLDYVEPVYLFVDLEAEFHVRLLCGGWPGIGTVLMRPFCTAGDAAGRGCAAGSARACRRAPPRPEPAPGAGARHHGGHH